MIIYCRTKKSKPRKSPKPQRDQYQSWLKSVQSMTTNFSNSKIRSTKVASDAVVRATFVRPTEKYRSVDTGVGNATKAAAKVYTGTAMKGIATMHKSNAVPVFTEEQAKEISSMRR